MRNAASSLTSGVAEPSGGGYAGAADLLGVHVNSLHRMIRRLGIRELLER